MEITQIRDLTVINIDKDRYLGVACDSCGAIGYKEQDIVKASPQLTAYHTAKVVFAELMSMGFKPILLSNGLAVEMNDTGKHLIEGFNEAISKLRTSNVHLTGSTEENIITVQTSMGITCIGICQKNKLKYKKTNRNDFCVLIGLPLVGNEVVNNPESVMDIEDYESLYLCDFIKEILPIGSRGTNSELMDMCKYNNLNFKYYDKLSTDLNKTGGPSCCCLVSIDKNDIKKIKSLTDKPFEILGEFY